MPIESATYIKDLNPDWPTPQDFVKDGDDQLRLTKKVIQNSFPNIDSAMTADAPTLNRLATCLTFQQGEGTAPNDIDRWTLRSEDEDNPVAALTIQACSKEQLNGNTSFVITWQVVQNFIYPVGKVIVSTKSANPADYLGFGTWSAVPGFLAGAGDVEDSAGFKVSMAAGPRKGNWRIQNGHIVEQDFDLLNGKAAAAGGHTPQVPINGTSVQGSRTIIGADSRNSDGKYSKVAGDAVESHEHDVEGKVTIGNGAATEGSAFQLPGRTLYVWERTA